MGIKLFLVVEDKPVERLAALCAIKKAFGLEGDEEIPFDPRQDLTDASYAYKNAKVMVEFAHHLWSAQQRFQFLSESNVFEKVMVLTDLMFPAGEEDKEKPNGMEVVAHCIKEGYPVVVCSDTHHHDVDYLRSTLAVLGKAHPKGEIPGILDQKDWDRAVREVVRIAQ
jgi:hypothetical protein